MDIAEKLRQDIEDSEMVLVGIGEEMGISEHEIMNSMPDLFQENMDCEQRLGYLMRQAYQQIIGEKYLLAYKRLNELIQKKNYFLVSVNTDNLAKRADFQESRQVFPCGGYDKLQCPSGCEEVWEQPDENWDSWAKESLSRMHTVQSYPEKAHCSKCGRELVFNNIYAEKYREEGYLADWAKYTKWLQGTVNHKVCILELGVGMKYPSVIRWPFEKIAVYNQKAAFYRIHSALYQMPDSLNGAGYSVPENPVDFLINKFV